MRLTPIPISTPSILSLFTLFISLIVFVLGAVSYRASDTGPQAPARSSFKQEVQECVDNTRKFEPTAIQQWQKSSDYVEEYFHVSAICIAQVKDVERLSFSVAQRGESYSEQR